MTSIVTAVAVGKLYSVGTFPAEWRFNNHFVNSYYRSYNQNIN
ncbi:hypothetical protein [Microcystis sp. LE18-22.4A]|nr:hypothetical protein [Microcystis sp. LE18-22.4A]